MQKDLEKLWFDYLIEVPVTKSEKEKQIINEFTEKEKLFRSKLNDEQVEFLEEYDNAVSKVNSISEKNAFVKGIMFATRFIFQALYND
ncbi:MAG: hypothetical protein IJZ16_02115 [Clostridia bacterium]|nr:hypothetical protein [Clostridia bacterium]